MFDPMTYADTRSATSSPASAFGATHCAAPDGPMTSTYGQPLALASLSARQAQERGLMTSGTYGLRSTTSPESAALVESTVSKLQARTRLLGSTLYKLTWKQRATPSGRLIFALRASVLRTSGSVSFGSLMGGGLERLGDAGSSGLQERVSQRGLQRGPVGTQQGQALECGSHIGGVADDDRYRCCTATRDGVHYAECHAESCGGIGRLAHDDGPGCGICGRGGFSGQGREAPHADDDYQGDIPGPTNGFWRAADWLGCRDGKWRPVEPGTFPLAHGATARVGRLRAYGNAINAEAAIEFIKATM